MILLQVNNITKSFGADVILSNIKMEVQTGDRLALVGRNGAGKSTLLKIITGEMSYDSGTISKPKNISLGYLAQDTGLMSENTIWTEMMTIFESVREMENNLRKLEQDMANPELFEKAMKDYDRLQERFREIGGFQVESDIRSVLHGLQFFESDYTKKISDLSGGQRTRLALGKLLLTKPDILVLDEPTNHLDIATLTWLENYLSNYNGAVIIVSHDRYFLDKISTHVVEISRNLARRYVGNYSRYLEQKAADYEHDMKLFEKQQDEISKLKDFIQRNIVRASTSGQAKSRRKMLEKMDVLDKPNGDEKSVNFQFEATLRSGNEVLNATDLAIGYDDDSIVSENINFRITRGDSIALIGPNGVGKSTLLKTIASQLPLIFGELKLGASLEIAYYDQEHAILDSRKTVQAEIWDDYPGMLEKEVRGILGNFLFSGDDVLKTISLLSGGERARVALAKLYLKKANFLILDEPTNHLDLDSKMVLENALIDFPGTILFVSHDRYFINRMASRIFELSPDGCKVFDGNYDEFVEKNSQRDIVVDDPADEVSSGKNQYLENKEQQKVIRQKKKRLEELEGLIATSEERIEFLKASQLTPEVYEYHDKSVAVQTEIEELEIALESYYEEWSELQE